MIEIVAEYLITCFYVAGIYAFLALSQQRFSKLGVPLDPCAYGLSEISCPSHVHHSASDPQRFRLLVVGGTSTTLWRASLTPYVALCWPSTARR